jgi:hypothetical protein
VPIFDKATGRVVAVIVLLIAIAASLRGYLPGVSHADRPPPRSGASLFYVAALLGVSLIIVAVAIIARLRDPRRVASAASPLPARFSEGSGRPAWKVMLIGAAVLVGWLVLAWLLSRFIGSHRVDQSQSAPPSTTSPPKGNAAQRPGPQDNSAERDVLHYLIASTVTLLLMSAAGAVVARRRRVAGPRVTAGQPLVEPAPVAPAAGSLVRAAESGLAEVEDPDREPRQAIIACYAAMELELRRHPGAVPQDFDTPSEVLARAVEHHRLRAENATELVDLFEEARFSPHVMTETHRGRAMDVLGLVLADMRGSA